MFKKLPEKRIDIEKASMMSAVMNTVEAVVLVLLLVADFFGVFKTRPFLWQPLLVLAVSALLFEACLSIRDAFIWRDTHRQNEMLKDAWGQLQDLNNQLRMQRHDFLNHFQVVYSLIDMGERGEAMGYIEQVYGQMKKLSSVMKTAKPAVNALLRAKLADAQQRGIQTELQVSSDWKNLPMNDWEMCRVLGNILDNAMDALKGAQSPRLCIDIFEDLRAYGFRITNNGPMIAKQVQDRIFSLGFTTKATGQGLGLHIVRELMEGAGGQIRMHSDEANTFFEGILPRGGDAGERPGEDRTA